MYDKTKDINLIIATTNGSGSQAANQILTKAIFRHGWAVGAKNLFPSNIAGLPTWFHMRIQEQGFVSRRSGFELGVALNPVTLNDDYEKISPGGHFFFNKEFASRLDERPELKVRCTAIPIKELTTQVSSSVKLKKLLANIIYVGILSRILKLPVELIQGLLEEKFKPGSSALEVNLRAFEVGREWAYEEREQLSQNYALSAKPETSQNKILITGNEASAMGLVFGGCSFLSWYPITPASSIAENFGKFATQLRRDKDGKNMFALVQAEDELSAITMVLGASWTGARALTSTSGPGVSLMAEAAGLSYFAEVPAVIWNVQRAGPSTGLPTRTLQSDIMACAHLSHGDTDHILLFPGNPQECFEMGQTCFDLAEHYQTLVVVLTDLDLGMQNFIVDKWDYPTTPYERGKILTEENFSAPYARFEADKDGLTTRSLPGTMDGKGAFFTRGTGHDEFAKYTENPEKYKKLLDRLKQKVAGAKDRVPAPVIDIAAGKSLGLIAFGSTDQVMEELRELLKAQGHETSYLRLRGYPFSDKVLKFIEAHDKVLLVEQNRDAQMKSLLIESFPSIATKISSVLSYDGQPISTECLMPQILSLGGIQ